MNIDLIERHNEALPASLVIGLTERALREELWHLAFDMIKESKSRTFGRFLLEVCYREIGRRGSECEIEASSYEIPWLEPEELGNALLTTNVYSYGPLCESLGKFFDYCHAIFLYQARERLRAIK